MFSPAYFRSNDLFFSSNFWERVKNELSLEFPYENSHKCHIELTAASIQNTKHEKISAPRTIRLDRILDGSASLPKASISYAKIVADANDKGIIPISMKIMSTNQCLEIVYFDTTTPEKQWIIQNASLSFIEYVHQYTKPTTNPQIRVDHFLQRGFPTKKDAIDAHYLSALASKQHVQIEKLIFYKENGEVASERPFLMSLGEMLSKGSLREPLTTNH